MSRNKLSEVILSVPPYVASPNQSIAPQTSASLGAAQYMLGLSVAEASTLFTTGDVMVGSTTVTNLVSTSGVAIGYNISGDYIPAGTTVAGIPTASSITLSQPAAATAADIAIEITSQVPFTQLIRPAAGLNTSISVNAAQVNPVLTYAGPQPLFCVPCQQPQQNITLITSGVSPNGSSNPIVAQSGLIAAGPQLNCCPKIMFEGEFT